MTDPNLQISWALDFLDEPFDDAQFRFWGGEGDLTLGTGDSAVVYRGTNGVLEVNPPREKAAESIKMSVVMDATDPSVREQLRHDIGPLRVRVRWIYYRSGIQGSDGITPFVDRATYWFDHDVATYPAQENGIISTDVIPVRFRSVGDEPNINTGTTYYAWVNTSLYSGQGWALLAFFDSEANANAAQNMPWTLGQTGRISLTTNGDNVVVGRFDSSEFVSTTEDMWLPTGKEFVGRLSAPLLQGSKYFLDIESQITDIQRGRVLNWSNDTQQARHPGDKGMEYLAEYAEGINTKWPS